MKKIVSLMALCVVLFGTVMTVTGCGNKPNKDSVWETTKQNGVTVPESLVQYWCFHSDGNVYLAAKLVSHNFHLLQSPQGLLRSSYL